jgi:hypothetical protein
MYSNISTQPGKSSFGQYTDTVFDRIARELARIGWCPPQLVLDCTMHRVKFDLDRLFERAWNAGYTEGEHQFRRDGE